VLYLSKFLKQTVALMMQLGLETLYVLMKSLYIKPKGVMYLSEKSEVLDKLDREMKTAAVKYH
jgi:hypothetical protein